MAGQEPAAAGTQELEAITVSATGSDGTTDGTGAYTSRAAKTATPLNLSLRDTPQSVSVITQQRIEDQQLKTVMDVVNNATGVSVNRYETNRAQFNELAVLIEPYKKLPEPLQFASLDAAVEKAKAVEPDMTLTFVFYPGYFLTDNKHHIAVLMKGNTPVTSRLLKPVLINAQNGEFTASVELPWYLKTLLLSQPLHFGDYAGLPLKILWALLDIISIIVLGSGLYLWFARRRLQDERVKRIAEKAAALQKSEGAAA